MQTTSLATSKALYDRGVRAESYFVYSIDSTGQIAYLSRGTNQYAREVAAGYKIYPRYTLCELLRILPQTIESNDKKYNFVLTHCLVQYEESVMTRDKPLKDLDVLKVIEFLMEIEEPYDNPTEAAGLMLLSLIDNGHVNINEVNKGGFV
jgi:hypothetical protein